MEGTRIVLDKSAKNESKNILGNWHRTPTAHCSVSLTLAENGYPHSQWPSAKKQNSHGSETI